MWLIDTSSLKLQHFMDSTLPFLKYAILSHTWDHEELSFNEWRQIERGDSGARKLKKRAGYHKIQMTCKLAKHDGFPYAWVDTCCIDKTSSSELSEAVNSMFRWYRMSEVCYAYLSDFESGWTLESLHKCRYFERSWTLQELIAPEKVVFYNQTWCQCATKAAISDLLSDITGVDSAVLTDRRLLPFVPVGKKMSWAVNRDATRIEDISYSLLGIFDVHMPLLYGEGRRAFLRLQEEILKASNDLSIFVWEYGTSRCHGFRLSGILAGSPAQFERCTDLRSLATSGQGTSDTQITNLGVRVNGAFLQTTEETCILDLRCCWGSGSETEWLFVRLHKRGQNYIRIDPRRISTTKSRLELTPRATKPIYVVKFLPTNELRNETLGFFLTAPNPRIEIATTALEQRIILHNGLPSQSWKDAERKFHFEAGSFWTAVLPFTFRFSTIEEAPCVRMALICTSEPLLNGLSLRQA